MKSKETRIAIRKFLSEGHISNLALAHTTVTMLVLYRHFYTDSHDDAFNKAWDVAGHGVDNQRLKTSLFWLLSEFYLGSEVYDDDVALSNLITAIEQYHQPLQEVFTSLEQR